MSDASMALSTGGEQAGTPFSSSHRSPAPFGTLQPAECASTAVQVRRAQIADVEQIAALINHYAEQGLMLRRTHAQLYNNLRDFVVAEQHGAVVGCAGLRIMWRDLAEVVSLAVAPGLHGLGVGRRLVVPLIGEAQQLAVPAVFALTYQVTFFAKLGFSRVPREMITQKVLQDCRVCAKHRQCDEVAMVRILTPSSVA